MSFMERSAKQFLVIKAAKEIRKEIEKAGLDDLKTLASNGISIIGTYLNGCSPKEKATHKKELSALLMMGVTPDMVLTEVARQMPELTSIMEGKGDYKKMELDRLEQFMKEGSS